MGTLQSMSYNAGVDVANPATVFGVARQLVDGAVQRILHTLKPVHPGYDGVL
jgi:hypothetical protein